MLPTLALLTVCHLAPAQAESLQLTHPQLTYGNLGPRRANSAFARGDTLFLSFDIEGIAVDEGGKARYRIGLEVTDSTGQARFQQKPRDEEAFNALGGGRIPALVRLDIGQNEAPGEYMLKVTVTDPASRQSQSLQQRYEVTEARFGLVRLMLSGDSAGEVPLARLGAGQMMWVNVAVTGFTRSPGQQPDVLLELRIRDESGKPTLARPFQGNINKGVPEKAALLPAQFLVPLNRPGKFTIDLQASERGSDQKARLSFPITVLGEE